MQLELEKKIQVFSQYKVAAAISHKTNQNKIEFQAIVESDNN